MKKALAAIGAFMLVLAPHANASPTWTLEDIATIRAELSEIGPEKVIWDYDDRSKRPPWGDDIASSITSLGDYFVTSGGEDLIEEMDKVLRRQAQTGGMAKFVTL